MSENIFTPRRKDAKEYMVCDAHLTGFEFTSRISHVLRVYLVLQRDIAVFGLKNRVYHTDNRVYEPRKYLSRAVVLGTLTKLRCRMVVILNEVKNLIHWAEWRSFAEPVLERSEGLRMTNSTFC